LQKKKEKKKRVDAAAAKIPEQIDASKIDFSLLNAFGVEGTLQIRVDR
jgi:hypothetical protein